MTRKREKKSGDGVCMAQNCTARILLPRQQLCTTHWGVLPRDIARRVMEAGRDVQARAAAWGATLRWLAENPQAQRMEPPAPRLPYGESEA